MQLNNLGLTISCNFEGVKFSCYSTEFTSWKKNGQNLLNFPNLKTFIAEDLG